MTRYLLYSHDTYGLGHFRRCGLLADGLVRADPDNEVLLVTGSPKTQAFSLPERVDTVKLPTATKDEDGSYHPRKLGGSIDALIRLRSSIIRVAAAAYEPDVILIDHAPLGMGGELRGLLDDVEESDRRPTLALGIRDVVDRVDVVDWAWRRDGTWEVLDRYDEVLVYGDPAVETTAHELGLADRTRARVTHVGYVAPSMPGPGNDEPFILVTAGGGGDGHNMIRRYLDAVETGATAGIRSVIVAGPLLSASRRTELDDRASSLPSVEVIEFTTSMRQLIASATGIVSMAGYNTVVEELSAGTPALLVPRRRPRMEQHIRASRLAPVSHLGHCELEDLSPLQISDFIDACTFPAQTDVAVDLTGVDTVVELLSHNRQPKGVAAHA